MFFPLKTDSYKLSHWRAYHPDTRRVYSYLEAREGARFQDIVFFGLQAILDRNFSGQRFNSADIDIAANIAAQHFGDDTVFNYDGWKRLLAKHGGKLPLRIRALPEGTVAKPGDVLMTIENTDDEFPWLTNWAETMLMQVWYPMTVATLSREVKKIILDAMIESCDTLDGLPVKLHDFGYRGSTSIESVTR